MSETRQQIKNAGRLYQADRKVYHICHPEALAEGSQKKIPQLVRDDKSVSKAHSKELNVLMSYRFNNFKKKAGATHVDRSDNIRSAAFTLAEVLITLGIIGIVAAMTIPALINNFQAKQYETKLNDNEQLEQVLYNDEYLKLSIHDMSNAGIPWKILIIDSDNGIKEYKYEEFIDIKNIDNKMSKTYYAVYNIKNNEEKNK